MRTLWILAAVGLTAIAACSNTEKDLRVDCGQTDVVLTGKQANAIMANTGSADFGTEICSVASRIDASSYTKPQKATVKMPSGNSYDVKLQVSQQ